MFDTAHLKQKDNYVLKFWGLVRWSLIRHKYLLPAFTIVQVAFSIAIVYGLALMFPSIDLMIATYLSSGALTLGIIAVGCVLAAQVVSTAKQDGISRYQKTLPVSRISILLSDLLIWTLASLPGVIMACVATSLRFDININITFLSCSVILLSQITMILIGFCLAYCLTPNGMAIMTQVIMLGGLLFSPITYPAERLPEWTAYIYNVLPFVPVSNLIRSTLFQSGSPSLWNFAIVLFWALATFGITLMTLLRRD